MKQSFEFVASADEIGTEELLKDYLQRHCSVVVKDIVHIQYHKKSIDARSLTPKIHINCTVFCDEQPPQKKFDFNFLQVQYAEEVCIIGSGPAGLFAALQLLELGKKPIIFERGKDVRNRRRDLANLTKQHVVDIDSNYCFGEGGAGTYSDGKLYTRSNKRGNVQRILELFVYHGADERILYESHPHIGTNKLPQIISAMRQTILNCGGEFYFEKKLTDILVEGKKIKGIVLNGNEHVNANSLILATGHSARDVFELCVQNNIAIEAKPFAMGVRIEHPQNLIDQIQYKCKTRNAYLPPATYQFVEQAQGRGVFSFCMCPGGIIAPAVTAPNEIVVNGWSPSKRNNQFANSGFVVSLTPPDWQQFQQYGPLAALRFQQAVEQRCYAMGNQNLQAPAQRLVDFMNQKKSATLPLTSYLPGTYNIALDDVLPQQMIGAMRQALRQIEKKKKAYITNEAVLLATESRTSSPVRIPRNAFTFEHIEIQGLYPCGEGAGYAGGIVSAAIDGENCAKAIVQNQKKN